MGMFGNSSKRSRTVRDWSSGPIEKQSALAVDAPDVLAFAVDAIRQAARSDRADLKQVLMAIDRVLSVQMDVYADALSGVDAGQMAAMREACYARSDFCFEMFFYGLTYFGPSGVAMCNGLVEQLAACRPQLVKSISQGQFDQD